MAEGEHANAGTSNGIRSDSNSSLDKFERLNAWLQQHGGQCQCVDFREYSASSNDNNNADNIEQHDDYFSVGELARQGQDKERGVHASTDIAQDTLLISVPRRCILTTDMGRSLPLAKKIEISEEQLYAPKHIYLVLYILWDIKTHGSGSFYNPYYDILPKSFPHIPIYWSPEELTYLEGSFLLVEITRRKRALWEDYCIVSHIAKEQGEAWFDGITLAEFQWARMVIMSRNFGFVDGTQARISAMVPQADMLNHQRPPEVKWKYNVEQDAFVVTAVVDIPAGTPLHESYGRKSNHRHLMNYGFSVENNFDDDGTCPNQVDIDLVVSITDPMFLRKMTFWLSDSLSDREVVVFYDNVPCFLRSSDTLEYAHPVGDRVHSGHEKNSDNGEPKEYHIATDPLERDPAIRPVIPSPSIEILHVHEDVHDEQASEDDDDDLFSEDDIHHEIYRRKTLRVCISDDENTKLLFSLLRALASNKEDLDLLTDTKRDGMECGTSSSVRTLRAIDEPISLRNEFTAMTILKDVMIDHLGRFPTSIDEDVSDLADKERYPPFSNQRNAKIQVKGEKEVLCHFLLWAQSATHVMEAMLRESNESVHVDPDPHAIEEDNLPTVEMAIDELHDAEVHSSILRYCDSVLYRLRASENGEGSSNSSTSGSDTEDDDNE